MRLALSTSQGFAADMRRAARFMRSPRAEYLKMERQPMRPTYRWPVVTPMR